MKQSLLIIALSVGGIVGGLFFVSAQTQPPKICGDGIIQTPNDSGVNEFCDDGGDSNLCTVQCGQKLLGWSWWSTAGWVSLHSDAGCIFSSEPGVVQAPDCAAVTTSYYVGRDVSNNIFGWAWSNNLGWICFGQTCALLSGQQPLDGWQAHVVERNQDQPPSVSGWAKIVAMGDDGWVSLDCANSNNSCATSNYGVRLGLETFYRNGVEEIHQPTLVGQAWHGITSGAGLGWLQFSPGVGSPWLQTQYGDVYAGQGIQSSRPAGVYNATYRILSNGTITLESEKGSDVQWVDPQYGYIPFPTSSTRYRNVLGSLNIPKIICQPATSGGDTCRNAYGQTVIERSTFSLGQDGVANPLNNQIYHITGDATVDDAVTWLNGSSDVAGGGTIVVDGDLHINANSEYASADSANHFSQLASIAWVVRGTIYIDPAVTKLVGAYIALGDTCAGLTCGVIATGSGNSLLEIQGLLMAKEFRFERTGSSPIQGSEAVRYDGRLLANTPPGLADFAAALPVWRSGMFEQ